MVDSKQVINSFFKSKLPPFYSSKRYAFDNIHLIPVDSRRANQLIIYHFRISTSWLLYHSEVMYPYHHSLHQPNPNPIPTPIPTTSL